jgi:MFS transporter, DHA1 family, inner membrane transport protein
MTGAKADTERRGFDARIWLLAIGTFATGTDTFVIAGILPDLARDLAVPIGRAGDIVSIYAAVYGIGTPLLAVAIARWRRDRVALGALLAFCAVNLLCAVAPSYLTLMALRAAAAICAAIYAPTAYTLAASFARPERRGAALAAVALGSSGSTVVGVPLGTFIGQAFGWHATFVLIAIITALGVVALAWRGLQAEPSDAPPQTLMERVAPLGRARVWLILAPALLLYGAIYVVYTYIVPLLQTHYAAADVPLFLVAYGLGGLAGSQLGGKLVDRFGATGPLVVVLTLFTLLEVALPLSLPWALATGAVMFGLTLCSWACFAPIQTRAITAEPAHANVMFALINSSVFLGGAVGAAVGGVLYGFGPVRNLPFVAAILTAIAVAIILRDWWRNLPRE